MSKKIIQGAINNSIEPFPATFKGLCDSPLNLLNFILSSVLFTVETNDNIIIKEDRPTGADKKLFWVKTSWPYGIGMMIDGDYKIDYGMCGYPINTPFLFSALDVLPSGLRKLTSNEITSFGIQDTVVSASDRMFWYLFTPETA